jgi:16S rRNA (adenine1518-N6/adenine1519-N6)-dimethyltransferase
MKLSEVQQTLQRLGLRPSKALGQHFLIDRNILGIIIDQARLSRDDTILEIGTGLGVLTRELLLRAGRVIGIEKDTRLCAYLRDLLPGLDLIEGDAVEVVGSGFPSPGPGLKVVANLPYNISTPVLERLVESGSPPCRMVLLLQREVADRLVARPRTKTYGALTLYTRLRYHPTLVHVVSARCFYPRPHVESAIVLLERRDPRTALQSRQRFHELVRTGFSQRRKTLRKLLARFGDLDPVLVDVGATTRARAEELDLDQWIKVANALSAPAG